MRSVMVGCWLWLVFPAGLSAQTPHLAAKSEHEKIFNETAKFIPLKQALAELSQFYEVNLVYDDILIEGKKARKILKYSKNLHQDLQRLLDHGPLSYTVIGKRTVVIIPASTSSRRSSPPTGMIRGTIRDEQGNGLPAAQVLIRGTSMGAAANDQGEFFIEHVPPGDYVLQTRMIGYRSETARVRVLPQKTAVANFKLRIDPLDMGEIVTTATRIPVTKIESSVAISTINSTEIQERPPRSSAELLKSIPGFYVESSGGESGNNLFPRGLPQDGSYRYIAIMEDGLPIFEAPELSFANIDILFRIDPTIQVVEGVRGGTASIFASNAPGGVIHLISKTGSHRTEGLAKFTIGDYGLWRMDVNLGGPLGRNWRYNIGGFFRIDNGIRNPDFIANRGGQIKANLTYLFKNGYARVYAKYLNDKNIFYLPIPLQNPDSPRPLPGFDPRYGTLTGLALNPGEFPTPTGDVIRRDIRDGIHPVLGSVSGEVYYKFQNGWEIKNTWRYMETDLQFNAIFSLDSPFPADEFAERVKQLTPGNGFVSWEYRDATTGERIHNPLTMNQNGLVARSGWWSVSKPLRNLINQVQIQRSSDDHVSTFGLYFSRYHANDFWYWQNVLTEVKNAPRKLDLVGIRASGEEVFMTKNGFEQFGTFYLNARNRANVLAFYVTEEWQATAPLRLDAGFRYEYANFAGKVENTRNDYMIPGATTPAEKGVMYGDGTYRSYQYGLNAWAFSMGANYNFNKNLATYVRASRGFRMPDFDHWNFISASQPVEIQKGETQRVIQLEGGMKLGLPNLGLFASVFSIHLDRIPFFDEVIERGKIKRLTRFARSVTTGLELETKWYPARWLEFNLIGTYQSPRLKNMIFKRVEEPTGRISTLNFEGNQVRRIPRLLLDFRTMVSFWKLKLYAEWQYVGRRFVDDANTAVLPAYHVVHAGATFKIPGEKIALSLNVANLTNTLGLTEGNPRVEQIIASRRKSVFMARPILGRTAMLSLMYTFR